MMYQVSTREGKSVRVRSDSLGGAAVAGAIKLGIRWGRRRPTSAVRASELSRTWHGGQQRCGSVLVDME